MPYTRSTEHLSDGLISDCLIDILPYLWCQLQHRTTPEPGEPHLASWDYAGPPYDEPAVDEGDLENCAQNGCFGAISYRRMMRTTCSRIQTTSLRMKVTTASLVNTVQSISGEDNANSDSNPSNEPRILKSMLTQTGWRKLRIRTSDSPENTFGSFQSRSRR